MYVADWRCVDENTSRAIRKHFKSGLAVRAIERDSSSLFEDGKFRRRRSRAQIEAGIKTSGEIKVSMLINLNSSAAGETEARS